MRGGFVFRNWFCVLRKLFGRDEIVLGAADLFRGIVLCVAKLFRARWNCFAELVLRAAELICARRIYFAELVLRVEEIFW